MMKALLLGFLPAVGAGLAATIFFELRGAAGWASWRIMKIAVAMLQMTIRAEREEEWQATWERWGEGAFGRLIWSLGLPLAGLRIGRSERRNPTPAPEPPAEEPRDIHVFVSDTSPTLAASALGSVTLGGGAVSATLSASAQGSVNLGGTPS